MSVKSEYAVNDGACFDEVDLQGATDVECTIPPLGIPKSPTRTLGYFRAKRLSEKWKKLAKPPKGKPAKYLTWGN